MVIWRMHSASENHPHHLHITVWTHHLVNNSSLINEVCESSSYKMAESVVAKMLKYLPLRNYLNAASAPQSAFITPSKSIQEDVSFTRMTTGYFGHPDSQLYRRGKPLLEVLCAATWPVPRTVIESIFEETADLNAILDGLSPFVHCDTETNNLQQRIDGWLEWLSDVHRAGEEFWVDVKSGHNRFAALFLKFCANKSISIEHAEQDYLV